MSAVVKELCLCLGLVIRQRRVALKLSQGELAERIGEATQRNHVSRVESTRHVVTLETLERYARALECKPSELLAAAEALVLEGRTPPRLEAL